MNQDSGTEHEVDKGHIGETGLHVIAAHGADLNRVLTQPGEDHGQIVGREIPHHGNVLSDADRGSRGSKRCNRPGRSLPRRSAP